MATNPRQPERVTTLVVVDDHEFAREAVAATLDAHPDLQIVGLAGTVADAKTVIKQAKPDIAVLDLNLPDGSGRDLVAHFALHQPELHCVIYTSSLSQGEAEALLEIGAVAVILKTLRGTELLDTIRRLASEHRTDPRERGL